MGRCYNSVVVGASAGRVWETIRDFHQLDWGAGVVTQLDVVGDKGGGEVGAGRVLNGVFHETLLSVDNDERSFTYSIDDGPGPVAKDAVSNYIGQVRVLPVTDTDHAFVEWESTYVSDDPTAVRDFCDPIYHALLQSLCQHLG